MKFYCPRCKNYVRKEDKYCQKCGAKLIWKKQEKHDKLKTIEALPVKTVIIRGVPILPFVLGIISMLLFALFIGPVITEETKQLWQGEPVIFASGGWFLSILFFGLSIAPVTYGLSDLRNIRSGMYESKVKWTSIAGIVMGAVGLFGFGFLLIYPYLPR
ncbi:unnamed protein product [marine sediment metagenome]|uniref:Zinc-ribbon domain-containing protein n=1 Tax=marine sediment metagenome TaxID=412755 RepID=X1RUK6_9ZZZZ